MPIVEVIAHFRISARPHQHTRERAMDEVNAPIDQTEGAPVATTTTVLTSVDEFLILTNSLLAYLMRTLSFAPWPLSPLLPDERSPFEYSDDSLKNLIVWWVNAVQMSALQLAEAQDGSCDDAKDLMVQFCMIGATFSTRTDARLDVNGFQGALDVISLSKTASSRKKREESLRDMRVYGTAKDQFDKAFLKLRVLIVDILEYKGWAMPLTFPLGLSREEIKKEFEDRTSKVMASLDRMIATSSAREALDHSNVVE